MIEIEIDNDLTIRTPNANDATALHSMVEKNRERLREFLVWVDVNQTIEHGRRFVEKAQRDFQAGTSLVCCIEWKREVVGCVSVMGINLLHRTASLGYWVDVDAQGHGVVSRSCLALIRYAFQEVRLHRIEIVCREDNTRSQRVAERIGATQEGILRESFWIRGEVYDTVLYSLICSDLLSELG